LGSGERKRDASPFIKSREDLDLNIIMPVYQPDLAKMKTWKAPVAEKVSP
jgi:hypothetical protein